MEAGQPMGEARMGFQGAQVRGEPREGGKVSDAKRFTVRDLMTLTLSMHSQFVDASEYESLANEVMEQRRLRDHFGGRAAHWNAEFLKAQEDVERLDFLLQTDDRGMFMWGKVFRAWNGEGGTEGFKAAIDAIRTAPPTAVAQDGK